MEAVPASKVVRLEWASVETEKLGMASSADMRGEAVLTRITIVVALKSEVDDFRAKAEDEGLCRGLCHDDAIDLVWPVLIVALNPLNCRWRNLQRTRKISFTKQETADFDDSCEN